MNTQENDHVEVHEMKGFMTNNLRDAFREIEAQSLGTKCKQYMFSLSLSPPEKESVSVEVFEDALNRIEKTLGLEGQARAVVFHEKNGRRHAHCVWSRIDATKMKAINLPYFKSKLNTISRDLYLENSWELPRGFINQHDRNPLNYTLAEYQQAKRLNEEPKMLKVVFQDCWKRSDNAKAFASALKEKGFILAKGDRRGFVAVDYRGEVFSLSRWTGVKTKDLKARLGKEQSLPSVTQAKDQIGKLMTERMQTYIKQVKQNSLDKQKELKAQKAKLVEKHRQEREDLKVLQDRRWRKESQTRQERIPKGWRKIWGYISGQVQQLTQYNENEVLLCKERDANQRQGLIDKQLEERQGLHGKFKALRKAHQNQMNELRSYIGRYADMQTSKTPELSRSFSRSSGAGRDQGQDNTFDRGRERRRDLFST